MAILFLKFTMLQVYIKRCLPQRSNCLLKVWQMALYSQSRQYFTSKKIVKKSKGSKKLYTYVEAARQLFLLCRQPVDKISINEYTAASNVSTASQSITQIDSKDGGIRMFMLPDGHTWPSFYATKQENASDTNLFFQRVSKDQIGRFNATMELLKKGKKVVSTGAAGIGKSTEVNAFLMEFLRHMGEKGWPPEVWFRFDEILLKFSLQGGEPVVEEQEDMTLSAVYKQTVPFWSQKVDVCPVLFLELREDEVNPTSHIATLVQLPNHGVEEVTKEFLKADAHYLLIDPPACEDLCNMAAFKWRFGSNTEFRSMGDENQVRRIVTERVEIVGPIARVVFTDQPMFDRYVKYLANEVDQIFDVLDKVSVTNVPKSAEFYIAPFVDDSSSIEVPYLIGGEVCMRTLSPYISRLIAKACSQKQQLEILDRIIYRFKILEDIVQSSLMAKEGESIGHDMWLLKNWKVYRNPAYNAQLTVANRLDHIMTLGIPVCKDKVYFDRMYFEESVSKLLSNTLYASRKHNGALYDCMSVDHESATVFMFQCSSLTPGKRKLSVYTIHQAMVHMKLLESGYKVRYIYCCPSKAEKGEGCKIDTDDGMRRVENKLPPKVKEAVVNAVEIYIARINF